ncbi:MAG: OmpA family protein [Flavobacteriales bacterium]
MSKKISLILGILLTIILGAFLYWKFCCTCCTEDKAPPNIASVNLVTNGLILKSKTLDYQCNENFNFKENDENFITPVSLGVDEGIAKLKENLTANPNQKITITGYCTQLEKNISSFPNLGYARADSVKNYLISQGIPSEKIEINGEIKEITVQSGIYYGPLQFDFTETNNASIPSNTSNDYENLKEEINRNPLVVHFKTNQSEISLDNEEKEKMEKITRYMNHVSDAKLIVTGHTDNVGSPEDNVVLSKKRAEFIAQYILKNTGLSADRMVTSGKGSEEPIADNTTAESKAKNRRTEIKIQ